MARTHGATQNAQPTSRFHQDDGVVLGKGGEPIPVNPIRGVSTLNPHGAPTAVIPAPPEPPASVVVPAVYQFICDKTTWQRNMDGWQALHLLNAIMRQMVGQELSVTLTEAEARTLPSDTRWHFKRVAMPVASDSVWTEPDQEADPTLMERIAQLEAMVAELTSQPDTLTDDQLFDADPVLLSRGDKIRRGKLLAKLARTDGGSDG